LKHLNENFRVLFYWKKKCNNLCKNDKIPQSYFNLVTMVTVMKDTVAEFKNKWYTYIILLFHLFKTYHTLRAIHTFRGVIYSISENCKWKANIVEFLDYGKYFHLICHLILTKINCITLKIRSKADFKSKSQTIWQQIILFSCTVMKMICTWPKIWTLSGRLSLMRTVQLMKKMSDASKNIFRVYHIRIIAHKKKMVHTTWNRQIPQ